MDGAKTHSGPAFPGISAAEQKATDDFNKPWNKSKRFIAHHAELLAALITAVLLLDPGVDALADAGAPDRRPAKYVPEPPDDAGPALAYGLAHEGEDSNNTVLATLLDLVERGYYDTKNATTDDEKLDLAIAEVKQAADRPSSRRTSRTRSTFFDELIGDETVPDERDEGPDPGAQRHLASPAGRT